MIKKMAVEAAMDSRLVSFLFITLFIVSRVLILLTNPEVISDPEELYRGALAKDLLEGLKFPLLAYKADEYSGGDLVTAFLAAPLFAVFGKSLFVLRMVPTAISLAVFCVTRRMLGSFFGSRAAFWGSVLLLLATPVWTGISFYAVGDHTESLIFTCGMLAAYFRFCRRPDNRLLIGFGLLAGFGFWFAHITLLTSLACVLAWAVCGRGFLTVRRLQLLIFSFAAGLTPWLLLNTVYPFSGAHFLAGTLGVGDILRDPIRFLLLQVPAKIGLLLFQAFPRSFMFPERLLGYFSGGIMFLALAGACYRIGKNWKQNDRQILWILPLALMPLLFFGIYGFSNILVPSIEAEWFVAYRYFVPLHYFLTVLTVIFFSARRHGWIALVLSAGLALYGHLGLYGTTADFGRILHYRGFSHLELGAGWRHVRNGTGPGNPDSFQKRIEAYNPEDRFLFLSGFSRSWPYEQDPDYARTIAYLGSLSPFYAGPVAENFGFFLADEKIRPPEVLRDVAFKLPEKIRRQFYFGVLQSMNFYRANGFLPDEKKLLAILPAEYRPLVYLNLGRLFLSRSDSGWISSVEEVRRLVPADRVWVYRGMGWEASDCIYFDQMSLAQVRRALAVTVPDEHQSDFFWGLGWGLRRSFPHDALRTRDWARRHTGDDRRAWQAVREGIEAFESSGRFLG